MMGILFGTIDFERVDQAREMLPKVRNMLARFSGKGTEEHVGPYSAQLYRPLVTTSRMDRRAQPHMFSEGCVLMLDGRIDNSTELRESLRGVASPVDDHGRWQHPFTCSMDLRASQRSLATGPCRSGPA